MERNFKKPYPDKSCAKLAPGEKPLSDKERKFIKNELILKSKEKESLLNYERVIEYIENQLPEKWKPTWEIIKSEGASMSKILERLSSGSKTSSAYLIPLLMALRQKRVVIAKGVTQNKQAPLPLFILTVIPNSAAYKVGADKERIDTSVDLGFYRNQEGSGRPSYEFSFKHKHQDKLVFVVAITMEFAVGLRTDIEHLAQAIAHGILEGAFGFTCEEAHQFEKLLSKDKTKKISSLDELIIQDAIGAEDKEYLKQLSKQSEYKERIRDVLGNENF